MREPILYLCLSLVLIFSGCSDVNTSTTGKLKPIAYYEFPENEVPPCLYFGGIPFHTVINSRDNYQKLRREHAHHGDYERFTVDKNDSTFKLSYQLLDTNYNDRLDGYDVIIYLSSDRINLSESEGYFAKANPFRIFEDSLNIYHRSSPYEIAYKVHYSKIFTVDPASGEVTFKVLLTRGSRVSMSGRRLYDSYEGKTCSMEYFDFSKYTIVGKQVTGNGCLKGFGKEILHAVANNQVLYNWWRKQHSFDSGGCPSVALSYKSWVYFKKRSENTEYIFQEKEPR